MRFTLPSLIATLLVAGLIGCGDGRISVPPELTNPKSAKHVEPASAESSRATVTLAADVPASAPEIVEPATAASATAASATRDESVIEANPFPSDQSVATPVATKQDSPGEQKKEIRAENCMVQYINKVNVPAKAEGTLMELRFEEGATIQQGDVLAIIDDTAASLAVELKRAEEKEAELNARNEVNLQDAVNSEKLAAAESEAFKELRREGAIPYWEMEKKRLEAERAKLRIDLAKMQKKIAEVQFFAKRSELEIAKFELTRRQVTAPATGFVEARIAQLGEWVQPGSPIATVIQMDRLRVEGDINVEDDDEILQGTPVLVTINPDSDNPIKINGKLGFVSMEIDLNRKLRVWVEVENKKVDDDWLIKPGMHADILIGKSGQVF